MTILEILRVKNTSLGLLSNLGCTLEVLEKRNPIFPGQGMVHLPLKKRAVTWMVTHSFPWQIKKMWEFIHLNDIKSYNFKKHIYIF